MDIPNARKVTVHTDKPQDGDYGVRVMAKGIDIDGMELLIPEGSIVTTSIGDADALVVIVSFFASDVRYEPIE